VSTIRLVDSQTTVGNFVLLERLGEGGMGQVWKAEDRTLKRLVALKLMKAELAANAESRARFLREARLAASVDHVRIVRVFGADEDRGIPYISMELLQGEPLDAYLKREPKPPLPLVLKIAHQVSQGLAVAHQKGLIHRDIKPSNIWKEHLPNDKIRFKILDFGLAKSVEGDQLSTQSGRLLGTPLYMAPEQWRNSDVDHRADLYSLGVLFYFMVTGRYPFSGENHSQIARAIEMDDPVSPKELNPKLPSPLNTIILRLLHKDPNRRPSSALDIIEALEGLRDKQPLNEEWNFGSTSPATETRVDMTKTPSSPKPTEDSTAENGLPVWYWIQTLVSSLVILFLILVLREGKKQGEVTNQIREQLEESERQREILRVQYDELTKRAKPFLTAPNPWEDAIRRLTAEKDTLILQKQTLEEEVKARILQYETQEKLVQQVMKKSQQDADLLVKQREAAIADIGTIAKERDQIRFKYEELLKKLK
jgi:serine/threonine protein kinase